MSQRPGWKRVANTMVAMAATGSTGFGSVALGYAAGASDTAYRERHVDGFADPESTRRSQADRRVETETRQCGDTSVSPTPASTHRLVDPGRWSHHWRSGGPIPLAQLTAKPKWSHVTGGRLRRWCARPSLRVSSDVTVRRCGRGGRTASGLSARTTTTTTMAPRGWSGSAAP